VCGADGLANRAAVAKIAGRDSVEGCAHFGLLIGMSWLPTVEDGVGLRFIDAVFQSDRAGSRRVALG
jgi:hypothetical protein